MKNHVQLALIVAAFFVLQVNAFSQKEETILGSNGLRLSGIWGSSKSQITRFGSTNSYMNGGVLGLEFGNALYIGYGSYTLTSDVRWDNTPNRDFNFTWGGPMIGYGLNNYKRFHPVFAMQAGQGSVWFDENNKDKVFVIQPSLGLEINVLRWFHIGLDGGYRFTSNADVANLTDSQLSGAFGQVSFKFGYSWNRIGGARREKKTSEREKM
jgi:hypothetical protein